MRRRAHFGMLVKWGGVGAAGARTAGRGFVSVAANTCDPSLRSQNKDTERRGAPPDQRTPDDAIGPGGTDTIRVGLRAGSQVRFPDVPVIPPRQHIADHCRIALEGT